MKSESHKKVNQCSLRRRDVRTAVLLSCLIVLSMALSSCGGSGSGGGDPSGGQGTVAGNWQFNLSTPTGDSITGSPLQGGFLLQKSGAISGQIAFSISQASANGGSNCNAGIATVTGTVSGQTVSFTAELSTLEKDGVTPTTQTITLSGGKLSSDGSTIQGGTYTMTAGYWAATGNSSPSCGQATDTGTWSATSVPALTGGFEGFFHSANGALPQSPSVVATLTQGPNTGASSATVTGTLTFQDPVTLLPDYSCLTTASVNGTISGSTVVLQIFGSNGTAVGQIGATAANPSIGTSIVTFDNTTKGYLLHNASGNGYSLTTKPCSIGDSGNLCLATGSSSACKQPISLTPPSLTFPPQLLGSTPSSQTITLTNNSSSQLTGAALTLRERFDGSAGSYGSNTKGDDFNGASSFTEQDTCTQQGTISLDSGKSCTITINFAPQESCPWLPQLQTSGNNIDGYPPAKCPLPVTATLNITVPNADTPDSDGAFAVPISGTGLSAIVPSVSELDFSSEAIGEASPPQTLTFTNQSPNPVSILPSLPPDQACIFKTSNIGPAQLRPPVVGTTNGLALAEAATVVPGQARSYGGAIAFITGVPLPAPTVGYFCDSDPPAALGGSGLPNFLISNDTCSGQTLQPFGRAGNSCSVQVTFTPQLATWRFDTVQSEALDDFLQLNTAWCGDGNNPAQPDCEIDSGRFPVEIKTNTPSPLRMTPGAALEFGTVLKGTASAPLTLTLFNDPTDSQTASVTFTSKAVTGTDYLETDNCPVTLAPNQSCEITVTFTPTISGPDFGQIGLTYTSSVQSQVSQPIYLRGIGQ